MDVNYGNNVGLINNIRGPIPNSPISNRQVYYITHKENGMSDSYMNRSFISFSFGGKNIEDFNLIAYTNGDRLSKQLTGNFSDIVNNYDVIDGQFYWGTYFSNNQLNLNLTTDGITQIELDNFKNWFAPGQEKELILAENPNRAIMARISDPPVFSMIPFEEKVDLSVGGVVRSTSTTLYKGEIELNFVMDSPFWYSKLGMLARMNDMEEVVDEWTDANGNIVSVLTDKDALKIIYEDGVPVSSMFEVSSFLSNGLYFYHIKEAGIIGNGRIDIAIIGEKYSGIISDSIDFLKNTVMYLYYAGTAPEKPDFMFNFKTVVETVEYTAGHTKKLITTPYNNTIKLTSSKEQTLLLGAPSVFFDYNNVVNAISNLSIDSYLKLRQKIKEEVRNYYVRKWVSCVINYVENSGLAFNLQARDKMLNFMYYFLTDGNGEPLQNYYYLNAKSNKFTAILGYRLISTVLPHTDSEWAMFGAVSNVEEDISEVVKSKYPILFERNHLDSNSRVQLWSENDKTLTYKIEHDFDTTLNEFSVVYQNKYY